MDQETYHRVFVIGVPAIAALLGVHSIYRFLRSANGPRERAWMVRMCVLTSVGMSVFCIGLWLVPMPYVFVIVPIYLVGLVLAARSWIKRLQAIRAEELPANPVCTPP